MAIYQIDPAILVSAATIILIGLVLVSYGLWGKTGWAPISWGLANVTHGIGWLVTTVPGYLSRPACLILANLLFGAAMGLFWSGTARFVHRHRSVLLMMMPGLVVLGTFPWFTYIAPSLPARIVIVAILTAVAAADSGQMLMRDRHRPTQLLGYMLTGLALVQVLRALAGLVAVWYPRLAGMVFSPQMSPALLLAFTVWTVGMLVSSAHRSEQRLKESVTQLKRASLTDQLTELPNRRFMQQRLEEAEQRLDQQGETFSILFLDLDHFKQINDTYGHDVGDQALQHVAHTLQRSLGAESLLARWGGEEFVMLMPNTDAAGAQAAAQQLRETLSRERFDCGPASLHVTVTIGGATASSGQNLADVIRRADHALYQGKETGRDQVTWA